MNGVYDFFLSLRRKKRFKIISVLLFITGLMFLFYQFGNEFSVKNSQAQGVRGSAYDLWADTILGQPDFSEGTIKKKVAYKVNNPGGTLVDRSKNPDTLFVSDNANSRILGYSSIGTCTVSGAACTNDSECASLTCTPTVNKSASIVIGQPDYTRSACNGDSGYQNYPTFPMPSASTLCGMPPVQISPLEGGAFVSFDVDSTSRLYYPDWLNNRVLMYNDPFNEDSVADAVWGQDSLTAYQCNKGGANASSTSICFGNNTSYNPAFAMGVDIDSSGNLWVADVINNRVLRFPFDAGSGRPAGTADVVLGQQNFTTQTSGSGLNQMTYPVAVRVNSGGNVYVADSDNDRVLYFAAPITSGMSGVSWGSNFDYPAGIEIDPASGGIWVSDSQNHRILLWNSAGTIVNKVLYQDVWPNPTPGASCSSSVSVCYQDDSRGSIGITEDGDLIIASSSNNQDAVRFSAPIPTPLAGTRPPADFRLFYPPENHNYLSGDSMAGPYGVAIYNDQIFVSDTKRVLFWNGVSSLNDGQVADGVVGAADFNAESGNNFGRLKADNAGHLFVAHGNDIEVYNLPLTSGETPASIITVSTLQNLEAQTVNLNSGGDMVVGGLYPTPDGSHLWVAHNFSNRVVRIRNPLTSPVVDVILGQTTASGVSCNRGGSATLSTLCGPGAVALDKYENVYVADNSLEVTGNGRLLEYDSGNFPDANSSTIYATAADKVVISGRHIFEPAFDSQNKMVVGYNTYSYSNSNHSLDYFQDPLVDVSATGALEDFYSMPYSMTFDSSDNLYVTDINRWKVAIYLGPFTTAPITTPVVYGYGSAGAPICDGVAPPKIPNVLVEEGTYGDGIVTVKWYPTGGNYAHIRYSADQKTWQHALISTTNDGVEEIKDLKTGTYYFSVSNGDGCAFSAWSDSASVLSSSDARLPDSGSAWPTFGGLAIGLILIGLSYFLFKTKEG